MSVTPQGDGGFFKSLVRPELSRPFQPQQKIFAHKSLVPIGRRWYGGVLD